MLSDIETLFSSSSRVQIMNLFLANPDRQFYQREIERETGQPIRAVQREVKRLEGIGMLSRSAEGNRVFYRLDPSFAFLSELTALFEKAVGQEVKGGLLGVADRLPPEPSAIRQPFPWMETLAVPPLPAAVRRLQVEGEWDQAY